MFKSLFRPDMSELKERIEHLREEQEAQLARLEDPMLDYWNKDIIWRVATANMGPGGRYFSGVELHANWNRPEEREPIPEEYIRMTVSHFPETKYSKYDYRVIAIGLPLVSAQRIAELRNREVLS